MWNFIKNNKYYILIIMAIMFSILEFLLYETTHCFKYIIVISIVNYATKFYVITL